MLGNENVDERGVARTTNFSGKILNLLPQQFQRISA
jgi:hypothetical protein